MVAVCEGDWCLTEALSVARGHAGPETLLWLLRAHSYSCFLQHFGPLLAPWSSIKRSWAGLGILGFKWAFASLQKKIK